LLAAAAMAKKKKARRSGRGETKEMEVQRTSSPPLFCHLFLQLLLVSAAFINECIGFVIHGDTLFIQDGGIRFS
jgi:hypothetical protein